MSCLDPNRALDFAEGGLSESERGALDAHLDGCADCRQLVAVAIAASSPEPERPDLLAERYRLTRALGRGGMGEVFEAYDGTLHETVALKVLAEHLHDNDRAVKYFKAEVQLARRITHPNVCRVFDLGVHERAAGALLFLTMELIQGETLRERLRRGPLALDEVARLGRELSEGLAAAHRAGVLHRDFKSDNVLLRATADGSTSAVITDFGLAQSLRGHDTSHFGGSVAYMSPEQVAGRALGPESDVYALGVVLFEMLTGSLPFRGETTLATALLRLSAAPPRPSDRSASVTSGWERLVLRCLAREPAQRFRSAEAVGRAIDELTRRPSARPRGAIARAALVAGGAAALLALGYESSAAPEAPPRPERVEVAREPSRPMPEPPVVAAISCDPPPRSLAPPPEPPSPARRVRSRPLRAADAEPVVTTTDVDALIDPFR